MFIEPVCNKPICGLRLWYNKHINAFIIRLRLGIYCACEFFLTPFGNAHAQLYQNFCEIYGIISARKIVRIGKKPCTFVFMGAVKMYKYRSKQIRLTDFNTPIGMKLNPDNRKKKYLN